MMPWSVSSTIVAVSASRSWASRASRRVRRPNNTAAAVMIGRLSNMIPVNFSEVAAIRAMPPMSIVDCRINCGRNMIRVSSIWIRSAERRLANSPTRRCAKNAIGSDNNRAYVSRRKSTSAF